MKLIGEDLKSKTIVIQDKSQRRVKGRASRIVISDEKQNPAKREKTCQSVTDPEELNNIVKPLSVVPFNPRRGKYTLIPSQATFFVGIGASDHKEIGERLLLRQNSVLPDIYANFPSQEDEKSRNSDSTLSYKNRRRHQSAGKRRSSAKQVRSLSAKLKDQRSGAQSKVSKDEESRAATPRQVNSLTSRQNMSERENPPKPQQSPKPEATAQETPNPVSDETEDKVEEKGMGNQESTSADNSEVKLKYSHQPDEEPIENEAQKTPKTQKVDSAENSKQDQIDGIRMQTESPAVKLPEKSSVNAVKSDEAKSEKPKISLPTNLLNSPDNSRQKPKGLEGVSAQGVHLNGTNRPVGAAGAAGATGYVKRGRPVRPGLNQAPVQSGATRLAAMKAADAARRTQNQSKPATSDAAPEVAHDHTGDMQDEDEAEVSDDSPKPPPLPPNARVPACITDPSVFPYDASVKCIRTLNKNPLDIQYGAWHRDVLPTLPVPLRNKSTGLRYDDLPNVYYLGKGNNSVLMDNHLSKTLGWKRTEDKSPDAFKLKWVQCVNQINFEEFRENEQLVNHIPNINCLTTKIGLVESLRAYERHLSRLQKPNAPQDWKMEDFFPGTYRLSNRGEFAQFRESYKDGETWICKPNGLNQGIGIYLVRSLQELDDKLAESQQRSSKQAAYRQRSHIYDRMVQRYIEKPLLLNNKKIDIRMYMLIASTQPFIVLYHPGYIRLCLEDYKLDDTSLVGHLNNQYIQKKDPRYKKLKETTLWSFEMANDFINKNFMKEKNLEEDWWYKVFERTVKRIMLHCFLAVKSTLKQRVGYFELLGFDFMIDEDMKIWLIEINCNPALATNCQVLDQVIPPIINESLDIIIEIWEKVRRGVVVSPIQSRHNMEVLYNETAQRMAFRRSPTNVKGSQQLNSARSDKRTTSLSPNREAAG